MALRSDSYSSVSEVAALTRHLLDGAASFDSNTVPSLTEVEKFIDRASGVLNICLMGSGFSTPITNSTAKLACSDWVTGKAVKWVELTQPADGLSGFEPNNRAAYVAGLMKSAKDFCMEMSLGFKRAGVTVSADSSDGLEFTALDKRSQRADPDSTTLEQPKFRRGLFDNS